MRIGRSAPHSTPTASVPELAKMLAASTSTAITNATNHSKSPNTPNGSPLGQSQTYSSLSTKTGKPPDSISTKSTSAQTIPHARSPSFYPALKIYPSSPLPSSTVTPSANQDGSTTQRKQTCRTHGPKQSSSPNPDAHSHSPSKHQAKHRSTNASRHISRPFESSQISSESNQPPPEAHHQDG